MTIQTRRSTTDLVVIMFTLMVTITVVLGAIGLIWIRISRPDVDIKAGSEFLGNIITTIVGALVGFVGGRAAGRAEANGQNEKKE